MLNLGLKGLKQGESEVSDLIFVVVKPLLSSPEGASGTLNTDPIGAFVHEF